MPKKPPRNSYYFFMLDYRRREEAQGRKFHGGNEQIAKECSEEWTMLPAADRERYERMAANAKNQRKNDLSQKYTSYGETFSAVEKKRLEEEMKELRKKEAVEAIVKYLKPNTTLRTKCFFLVHVNYFCITQKNYFHIPAELAICSFNLQKGIINSFQVFFLPESLPLGYAGDAKIHTEKTHKIPFDFKLATKDHHKIYERLINFLREGRTEGELPPLYTLDDDEGQNTSRTAVENAFQLLYNKTHTTYDDDDDAWTDEFKIYNLSQLFFELKNKTSSCCLDEDDSNTMPKLSLAEFELRKDIFNYTRKIACEFHESEDNVAHCSLAFVRRWVYIICDWCCQDLDIELLPGSHVPLKSDTTRSRTTTAACSRASSRMTNAEVDQEDVDSRSITSSLSSLNFNTAKKANSEHAASGGARPKVPVEPQQALRLPKSAKGKTDQGAVSNGRNYAQSLPEPSFKSIGRGFAMLGMKTVDPNNFGDLEILQGADEIEAARARRKAASEAAVEAKPLFEADSFPSLPSFGRGRKVLGRGGRVD